MKKKPDLHNSENSAEYPDDGNTIDDAMRRLDHIELEIWSIRDKGMTLLLLILAILAAIAYKIYT